MIRSFQKTKNNEGEDDYDSSNDEKLNYKDI